MKNTLIALGGLLLIGLISVGLVIQYNNTANVLKNSYEAKLDSNRSEFDNTWKKIKQSSQIPEQKKEAFRQIFTEYANARNGGGENQIMTWVTESAPNIDLNSYDELMNIVVSSRNGWTMRQNELISISEQYNKMLVVFPSNFILKAFGHKRIVPKVITSEYTEESFSSEREENLEIF